MDIAEEAVAGTAAQGDLAEVVARAGAMAMAAAPSHHRRPPSPSPAAADHSHVMSRAAGQIMAIPPACYDEEQELRPAAACGDAVMFDVPSSMVVDPYHQLSSSAATAPPHGHGGYWLPPQQISQQACYGLDVAMGGAAAADADGDEPMMMRISPVTPPPPSHHQIMKRKNEVKKVVCIPALPPASSRPGGGEVIPSDLWAWRKYGQKPIKGSPYPRGYYRCSSSKGCMARKQVERSRSDPNMLVITYTAEHNHPWPMQRNVLAGYSRPHTHMSNCKKKNSCRVEPTSSWPTSSSSSSSSKNANYFEHNVVPSSNIECQQMTNMMEDNAAGYVAYAIDTLDEEGVAMHQPINRNSIQPSDEVFAELEELEPSNNPVNANIYSRGVSYEWQKF
ncbi:probable WRKY transcription factor 35 isoform X2 [Sorghum bicolor]|uniref:WRKY domain-containing protein n=1 Tax=Sorghum bicolor TaxID=4558 RepID=A0A1B6QGN9_SORBI|nr:probable WRKY transcription factor 35 isoform X2 [Sorghum bicolor]KXG37091.1 hypothetical protein SORBI_3001G006600 [Sorghum bicolor]|eukprot:XP_021317942.1 probable WRKY transcription factor 35 isoform X2 [Sorghum bicolor]